MRACCLLLLAPSLPAALVSTTCAQGTLFRWSADAPPGGPDLDEPLVTDRPDFTEASVTVGKDVLQIEFGYTFLHNDDSGVRARLHSWGEPLFRYGVLADWLELRLAVFPVTSQTTIGGRSDTASGTEDLYLGLKLALTGQDGLLPETALIPQMTVPSGSNAFTSDEVLAGLNGLYSWEINDCLSTAGSTQFNRAIDGGTGREYTEWAQSWTVAYSLTDKLGAYTEWFALMPAEADTEATQHYFDGGVTYLFSDNIQWDIRAGVGLNEAADDFFAGTGFSIRLK